MSEEESKQFAWPRWLSIVAACFVGVAGGWVGDAINLPLGWMIGAMIATGVLVMLRIPLQIPTELRELVLSIIGIYLGASFTTDVLTWLGQSAFSVAVMCLLVAFETVIASYLLAKFLRCNMATSICSCVPGGFSTMVVFAREHGGNEEIVAIVQSVRMVLVVSAISLIAKFSIDQEVVEAEIIPKDVGAAIAIGVFGLVGGALMKKPIFCMFIPMSVGAILQLGSVTEIYLPKEPLILALVILGISVGMQWKNFKGHLLVKCLFAGICLAGFLISVSYFVAIGLAELLKLDALPLVLALSPGGVAEISLISVALNINPAFVVLHHLLRVVFILMLLPIVFNALSRRSKASA